MIIVPYVTAEVEVELFGLVAISSEGVRHPSSQLSTVGVRGTPASKRIPADTVTTIAPIVITSTVWSSTSSWVFWISTSSTDVRGRGFDLRRSLGCHRYRERRVTGKGGSDGDRSRCGIRGRGAGLGEVADWGWEEVIYLVGMEMSMRQKLGTAFIRVVCPLVKSFELVIEPED